MQAQRAMVGRGARVRATSRSYILLAPAFVPLRYPVSCPWSWLRSWIAGGSRENSSLLVSDRMEYTRAALLIRAAIYSRWPTFLHVHRYLPSSLYLRFACPRDDRAFRFSPLFHYLALYHLLFYDHRSPPPPPMLDTRLLSTCPSSLTFASLYFTIVTYGCSILNFFRFVCCRAKISRQIEFRSLL